MKPLKELLLKAQNYENQKQWESALKCYEELYQKTENKKLFYKMGYLYSQIQDHKKAIQNYLEYLKKFRNDEYAYHNLGIEYLHLKEYEKSILALKKSLELNPNFLRSYLVLGYIYERLNDFENSIRLFRFVLQRDPKNKIAILGVIFGLVQLKQWEIAKKECESYLKLYPDDLKLKDLYSGILFQLGQTREFIREIKELSQRDERFKNFDDYLREIKDSRNEETQQFFSEVNQKLIKKTREAENKKDKKSYLDLSLLYLFSGEKEKAFDFLIKAMESKEKHKKNSS